MYFSIEMEAFDFSSSAAICYGKRSGIGSKYEQNSREERIPPQKWIPYKAIFSLAQLWVTQDVSLPLCVACLSGISPPLALSRLYFPVLWTTRFALFPLRCTPHAPPSQPCLTRKKCYEIPCRASRRPEWLLWSSRWTSRRRLTILCCEISSSRGSWRLRFPSSLEGGVEYSEEGTTRIESFIKLENRAGRGREGARSLTGRRHKAAATHPG